MVCPRKRTLFYYSAAGWGHPALRSNKKHCAVGAGHAPPATVLYNEYNGSSVGAAYMPPAQPSRKINLIGKRHRRAMLAPTTCRKFAFHPYLLTFRLFVGRGLDPSLLFCGNAKLTGKLQLWLPPKGKAFPPPNPRKSEKINSFFKGFHIAFFRENRYNMNQDGRLGGNLLFPRYLNPKV